MTMPNRVAALLRQPAAAPLQLRFGVVTSTSPFEVQIGSATTGQPARALTSYATPAVDDVVAVLVQGADRVVIGTVV